MKKSEKAKSNFASSEFSDAHSLIDYLYSKDSGTVFRGQSNAEWALESTLERAVGHKPNFEKSARFAESAVVDTLKSRLHHYLHRDEEPRSQLGWLSIAQHHGAPTRCLDFTIFPLVALYFAISGASASHPFAIWTLNFRQLNSGCEKLVNSDAPIDTDPDGFFDLCEQTSGIHCAWIGEPRKVNLRLERQGGTFLIPVNSADTIASSLFEASCEFDFLFEKITCDPCVIPEVKTHLKKSGVTASRLFDGVDGLAKEISDDIHRITQ